MAAEVGADELDDEERPQHDRDPARYDAAASQRDAEQQGAQDGPASAAEGLGGPSEREVEVLRLVARGRANAEIGREPFLSEATVKTNVSRLLARLGARYRVQVAVVAYETGLVGTGVKSDIKDWHVPL